MAFGALNTNNTKYDLGGAFARATGNVASPSPMTPTPPAPTTPAPVSGGLDAFDASSYGLNENRTARLDKFADIIASGGTLTPQQEKRLSNLSERAGLDFASTLGYTPTSGRYDYTAPTAPQSTDVSNLNRDDIREAGTPEGGLSATEYTQNLGMVENPWTASSGDLYENLNPNQENKLAKLSGLYAESLTGGDPLKESQLNKLTK